MAEEDWVIVPLTGLERSIPTILDRNDCGFGGN